MLIPALLLLTVTALLSCTLGSYPISLPEMGQLLMGKLENTTLSGVFWQLRVPRVVMGLTAGCALGLAGGVYQLLFRNPLASPDLTGVASGASLGAALALVLGGGSWWLMMAGSFALGILSLILVLLLVEFSGIRRTGSYVLAGIVIASAAEAGLMLLKYMADPTGELAAIEFWTMGSLGKVTASRVYPCLPLILLPMALMLCSGKQLLLLSQGSAQARQLGLAPGLWRGILLGLATWMTAGVISVTGAIAFVGLIAPHIAFSLYRRRGGLYLLFCMAVGGELLLAADILARMLVPYAELPLSILTVAFSLPVLLLALRRRRKEAYGTDF